MTTFDVPQTTIHLPVHATALQELKAELSEKRVLKQMVGQRTLQ
jgi:hypothetical protein